ncbi:hypothetical protein D1AOALGA4SA_123 [Olavius algarvensis Delta 1 endosymbiont]|nr:hypothetical protein D1AOALGA4SA_123 [Olavius algarvensis Delta 1 endosymbiont]
MLDDQFPPNHDRSLIELARHGLDRFYSKGALYLSPLNTRRNYREMISRNFGDAHKIITFYVVGIKNL